MATRGGQRAEFGRGQARGAPRGLTWRELAGRFSGPDGGSAADGAPSGWEWKGSQSSGGATELVFPGPALGQMQGEAARLAGEPSGEGEEASSERLGGHQLLAQTEARRPAGQQLCWLSRKMGNFGGTRTTPCRVIFDHGV